MLLVASLLAGCGGRMAPEGSTHAVTTPSPSPSPSASPSRPAGPVLPGEAVILAPNGALGLVSADGTWQWSFQPASLHLSNPEFRTAGPDLLAVDASGAVLVIDRAGDVLGRGRYTMGVAAYEQNLVFGDPTGTRWTWATLDSGLSATDSTSPWVSSLWVAGLGEAPHRVKTWSESNGVEVRTVEWADAGVVLQRVNMACGGGQLLSSSVVDPASGRETPLFGAGVSPMDVHAGVRTGLDRSTNIVTIAATSTRTLKYDLPVHVVHVNPSGTRVEVSTFGESGCGGEFRAQTDVVDVATGTRISLEGFFADAWLDDEHLLGRTATAGQQGNGSWSTHVQVADLGDHVSNLVLGTVVGVLRPEA